MKAVVELGAGAVRLEADVPLATEQLELLLYHAARTVRPWVGSMVHVSRDVEGALAYLSDELVNGAAKAMGGIKKRVAEDAATAASTVAELERILEQMKGAMVDPDAAAEEVPAGAVVPVEGDAEVPAEAGGLEVPGEAGAGMDQDLEAAGEGELGGDAAGLVSGTWNMEEEG